MKVVSIKEYKKGGAKMTVELNSIEYNTLFVFGIKKTMEDSGVKVMVLTIPEAEKLGVKTKKTVEFSKKDCDDCVRIAILDALDWAIKNKWKPRKCSRK